MMFRWPMVLLALSFVFISGTVTSSEIENDPIFSDRFEDLTFQDCDECPVMVRIPAGRFTQGSPEDERAGLPIERPQRQVRVEGFAMGQSAVTFAEWDACVAAGGCSQVPEDNDWGRGDRPVVRVSWEDAQQYVAWLTSETGRQYRLPSESEWEYAARARVGERFNTGDCITTDEANFNGTLPTPGCPLGVYAQQTVPVRSFAPNRFGLYDMHGNVWEWVEDCWNDSYTGAPTDGSAIRTGDCTRAIIRGGSWFDDADKLRSAYRFPLTRNTRSFTDGFRVAVSLAP